MTLARELRLRLVPTNRRGLRVLRRQRARSPGGAIDVRRLSRDRRRAGAARPRVRSPSAAGRAPSRNRSRANPWRRGSPRIRAPPGLSGACADSAGCSWPIPKISRCSRSWTSSRTWTSRAGATVRVVGGNDRIATGIAKRLKTARQAWRRASTDPRRTLASSRPSRAIDEAGITTDYAVIALPATTARDIVSNPGCRRSSRTR